MTKRYATALMWFRRDLRLADNAALYHALKASARVYGVFVFDTEILDKLPSREDRRVEFIWESLRDLDGALARLGGGLTILHGRARDEVPALAARLQAGAVYSNRDYEPGAIDRDREVALRLEADGRDFYGYKDHVVFDTDEVLTQDGRPFSVFTPYRNAWLRRLEPFHLEPYPVERYAGALAAPPERRFPSLEEIGFRRTNLRALRLPAGASGAETLFADFAGRIDAYHERRDYPAVKGPSYLSVHLRFGTISIRRVAAFAHQCAGAGAATWLSELVWRDFYSQILYRHPRVVDRAFKPEYDAIRWPNDEAKFAAWREARTGYPLVDAAMRQINTTGYMHNRLRMVTASFLVKDLHVDWRWGERYFADQLIDYDLASNNGGWQWAASTGCDAQPYFRIFNPVSQSRKFDPQGRFIRRYLPELDGCDDRHVHAPWEMNAGEQERAGVVIGRDYPAPIVDHDAARKQTLELYSVARRGQDTES
ncbi:MAG TPA: deoxyribodipyrimidine photo-lyase [Pelomicrobium sp.]|nr:deoxyribodipyrimidine photo-lyase [Pelomicrobium sp.]